MLSQNNMSRAQVAVLYLILTTAIASGIAIYSSASTITVLLKTATSGLFLPLLISLIVSFFLIRLSIFLKVTKSIGL
ncbi:hypothetical protein [uncultured Desulfuromusa sp.]|uniref:hypothetical protein n=1 Tax=uncultured Desulfuromusa sp. TaxID=219183 RepID=UPI0037498C64